MSATTSSVRWILNDPVGSVKNQLRAKNPTIAAASPDSEAERPDRQDGDEQDERGLGEVGLRRARTARDRADRDDGRHHPQDRALAHPHHLLDTIARIAPADRIIAPPRPGPGLAFRNADVRNALDARSRRLGDPAPEARTHPGGAQPRSRRSGSRCTRSTR